MVQGLEGQKTQLMEYPLHTLEPKKNQCFHWKAFALGFAMGTLAITIGLVFYAIFKDVAFLKFSLTVGGAFYAIGALPSIVDFVGTKIFGEDKQEKIPDEIAKLPPLGLYELMAGN